MFRHNREKSLLLKQALAFRTLMEDIPINIYDNELLVGGITEKRKGAFLSPETNIDGMSIGRKLNQTVKKLLIKITDTSS